MPTTAADIATHDVHLAGPGEFAELEAQRRQSRAPELAAHRRVMMIRPEYEAHLLRRSQEQTTTIALLGERTSPDTLEGALLSGGLRRATVENGRVRGAGVTSVVRLPGSVRLSGWFLTRCQHRTAAFVANSG